MQSRKVPVTEGSARRVGIEVGGFRVSDVAFPGLFVLPPHYHERACLSIVLEGSFDETLGSSTHACHTASVLVKPPGERHSDLFPRGGSRQLIVELDAPGQELPSPCRILLDRFGLLRDAGMAALAWRIAGEVRAPDAVTPLAVEGMLFELLAAAARTRLDIIRINNSPPWLRTVRDLLHARFAAPLTIGEVASEVGVHPDHLARVFRAHYGMALGHYVRKLRLDWAANALSTSDATISDLALQVGFADQSHFTRAFKAHTGLTPARYRQATRHS